jgi:hypothetical protein
MSVVQNPNIDIITMLVPAILFVGLGLGVLLVASNNSKK